ncbi:MAG: maturase [Nitrososphaerota archaeon]|jgi:group II intron reverse transcriptase/maturase|nr:maturase [Nitrososphaerota archaeon]
MRDAEKILSIISERGKNQKPLERIYRLLFNEEFYLIAYQNIYANKGAITKGINNDTVDGMSIKKITAIISKLKTETYRWTPVRRTYIKKKNGKQRPLGLPSWSDKLLQEVIRIILEAYYDNQFSNHSHGFRKNRGCQTALETLAKKDWKGIKWFIEGDVTNCFNSFDHQILMNILDEKIADKRFLRLIKNFLQSGYMEDWKYNKTLSGCPQGGVLSPLLSNVYMDKLDQYVENELMPIYNKGKDRARNHEYLSLLDRRRRYIRHGKWEEAKELKKLAQTMPSNDTSDPNFRRLYFLRYADDWIIGLSGDKNDAEEIKGKIATALQVNLKLQLNQEKTLITHARSERARFLGYDIHVLYNDAKHDKSGRRCINGQTGLRVPRDKMRAKIGQYMAKGKPVHRQELTRYSDYDIISTYQSEFRGFVQYYLRAYNAHQMRAVKYIMEMSLAKTLAVKHKMSVMQVFRKYKATTETKYGLYKVLQVIVERDGKKPLIAQFGGVRLAYNRNATIDEKPRQLLSNRSQLIDRLLRNVCELCGATGNIEMHHVKKLKDLSRSGRRHKPEWMKRMIAIRRKTLAVCVGCHREIHSGEYDKVRVH